MGVRNHETILLVEDEGLIAMMAMETLKRHGFQVITASSGSKAIDIVQNTSAIDLILMDINLGKGMDGTETAEIILRDHDIPVVFLSSHTEKDVVEKTERITSYGYVVKDSGETVLLASIKMAFKLHEAHKKLKQREEALQEREAFLGTLLDATPIPVFYKDRDGRYLGFNRAFETFFGAARQHLIGKTVFDINPPELAETYHAKDTELFESRETQQYETQVDALGERRDVVFTKAVFTDKQGAVSGLIGALLDITDQMQAEKARKALERRLSQLIDFSPDPTLAIDGEKRVIVWNRAMEVLSGVPAAEMMGKGDYAYTVPFYGEARPQLMDLFWFPEHEVASNYPFITKEGDNYVIEVFCPALAGGKGAHVWAKAAPLRDADGCLTGAIEVIRDMTVHKRAEETNARLAAIVEFSDDAIIGNDLSGIIATWNRGAERIYGYTAQEVINKSISILAPPDYADEVPAFLDQIRRGESIIHHETVRIKKDGSRMSVSLTVSPVKDASARVVGASAIVRDITDLKKAENDLREAEAKYRGIFEDAVMGIFQSTPDGRFIGMNQSHARVYGFDSPAEMMQAVTNIQDQLYVNAEDRARLKELYERQGFASKFEIQLYRRDKSRVWISTNSRAVTDSHGKIAYYEGTVEDITEKKRAEEELQKSEQRKTIMNRIANIFLTIPDESMYADVLTVVLEATGSRFGIFGFIDEKGNLVIPSLTREIWSECQVIDKSVVFPSSTWGGSVWGKAIREKRAFYSEGPFLTPEGHLPIDCFLTVPIVFSNETIGLISLANKVGGYDDNDRGFLVGISDYVAPILSARLQRDRHEREIREAEETIQESEEKFRLLFEKSGDPTLLMNGDTFIDCNEAALKLMRCSRDQLLGLSPSDVSPEFQPDGRLSSEKARELIETTLKTGVNRFEWMRRTFDGEEFWVEVSHTVIPFRGKRILYTMWKDIRARKRAEEELLATHQQLLDIIEFLPEATLVIDNEKKVVAWNRACEEMTGVPKRDVIGKGNYAYAIPFYGEARPILIDYVTTDSCELEQKYQSIRRVGCRLHAETFVPETYKGRGAFLSGHAAALFDRNGKVVGAIECVTDVTEFRCLETRLLQSQKMEAIGTLTGGIAHDFNNILTALVGYAALLKMRINDATLQTYVDQILSASKKATDLVQSLLAFSKQQAISLRPVSLHDIIKGTEKLLNRLLTEDISIRTVLAPNDITIMADVSQIDQILFNLATNARDAMPQGGSFTVETRMVELSDDFERFHGYGKAGRYAFLSVSDTGMGMDEATREKIFDPFFSTKATGKGTGLGLSTVYGIVLQHNGYITVYSEPNIGTTFHIYLPSASETSQEEHPAAVPSTGGDETILVVEDNEAVRRLICKILNEYGYTTIEAVDGLDAIQQFKTTDKIDLLILDSVMPNKNGREAYNEICKIKWDIRVIFTSGYTRDVFLDKGIEDEKFNFLQKPILPNVLLQKVRDVLDARQEVLPNGPKG